MCNNTIGTEFHGDKYFGWDIPKNLLNSESVIVDIGLGENISFSSSIINKYDCCVHGFDPTPRSIEYIEKLNHPRFILHKSGISTKTGTAKFFLPNNNSHVSGTLNQEDHTGINCLLVDIITIKDIFRILNSNHIDLLKLDIEGSEYELFSNQSFLESLNEIKILCIEFHHRWKNHGCHKTNDAIEKLKKLGFICIWVNKETNEEYTFFKNSEK